MTTRQTLVRHQFAGGWVTDLGPSSDQAPARGGTMEVPFLVNAENIVYELDGGPRKVPGTTKLSAELESGATVKGIFDYWISGTGGSPAQHRICHVGTKIKKDDGDGNFSDIFTGLVSGAVPSYTVLEDLLIISSSASADVPRSWDGTTAQNLAGSPPNFAFATTHKNRVWAAGVPTAQSRLYYSGYVDPENWNNAGSGYIDIRPDDGSVITGLVSHRNDLFVFKGPHRGSITRVTGSSPTGGDPFAVNEFDDSVGAVSHNGIFHYLDDIGFIKTDGHIGTLSATDRYGDFAEATLTFPIQRFINLRVNFARLQHAWAVNWPSLSIILFALPIDSSNDPNIVLMLDYRFDPPRWAQWPDFGDICISLGLVVDSGANNREIVMAGGNDGYIRKLGQPTRSIDGDTGISYRVTTPYLTYGDPWKEKTFTGGSIAIQPLNSGNVTFGWARDEKAQQTNDVSQSGGDVLGPAAMNEFTLGTSTLGGANFIDKWFEDPSGGQFRSIQYELSHATNNEDVEVHSFSAILEGGTANVENA